jgi:sugar/nucleoside kinase (ribokinase family)
MVQHGLGSLPLHLQEACRIAGAAGVPVWFEPVSVAKSVRATAVLCHLAFISPNEEELVAMASAAAAKQFDISCSCSPPSSIAHQQQSQVSVQLMNRLWCLRPHIAILLAAGVQNILLTLGAQGAVLCHRQPSGTVAIAAYHVPALPAAPVNLSGAGDCLVAGCLFALLLGMPAEEALAYGVAAAKVAVECNNNVPPQMDPWQLTQGARQAAQQATAFHLPMQCRCSWQHSRL